MNYKITILVEDEDDNEICRLSTEAGMSDFEENVIRKAEHSIKEWEGKKEYEVEMDAEREQEDLEEEYEAERREKQERQEYEGNSLSK